MESLILRRQVKVRIDIKSAIVVLSIRVTNLPNIHSLLSTENPYNYKFFSNSTVSSLVQAASQPPRLDDTVSLRSTCRIVLVLCACRIKIHTDHSIIFLVREAAEKSLFSRLKKQWTLVKIPFTTR